MNPLIDKKEIGQFFAKAAEVMPALQNGFARFREHLAHNGGRNGVFNWTITGLAENGRSFELEYLTLKVRVVLTIRPHVDDKGVITFYRLDEFDPQSAVKIDSFEFEPEFCETGIRESGGSAQYITTPSHANALLSSVLHTAYVAEGVASA